MEYDIEFCSLRVFVKRLDLGDILEINRDDSSVCFALLITRCQDTRVVGVSSFFFRG